nr:hypothetical protein [Streptomyces albidoflavus]
MSGLSGLDVGHLDDLLDLLVEIDLVLVELVLVLGAVPAVEGGRQFLGGDLVVVGEAGRAVGLRPVPRGLVLGLLAPRLVLGLLPVAGPLVLPGRVRSGRRGSADRCVLERPGVAGTLARVGRPLPGGARPSTRERTSSTTRVPPSAGVSRSLTVARPWPVPRASPPSTSKTWVPSASVVSRSVPR